MDELSNPWFDPDRDVITPATALQGLAHPLRLRLLGTLRRRGPSTATRLAEALSISSGLASYHLRQLAAAGFIVRADEDDLAGKERGGARERWWKAARRATHVRTPAPGDEDAEAATTEFLAAVLEVYLGNARSWLEVAHTWPRAWQESSDFSDLTLRLSVDEARELAREISTVMSRYERQEAGQPLPTDKAEVAVQYQIFPIADQVAPAESS